MEDAPTAFKSRRSLSLRGLYKLFNGNHDGHHSGVSPVPRPAIGVFHALSGDEAFFGSIGVELWVPSYPSRFQICRNRANMLQGGCFHTCR